MFVADDRAKLLNCCLPSCDTLQTWFSTDCRFFFLRQNVIHNTSAGIYKFCCQEKSDILHLSSFHRITNELLNVPSSHIVTIIGEKLLAVHFINQCCIQLYDLSGQIYKGIIFVKHTDGILLGIHNYQCLILIFQYSIGIYYILSGSSFSTLPHFHPSDAIFYPITVLTGTSFLELIEEDLKHTLSDNDMSSHVLNDIMLEFKTNGVQFNSSSVCSSTEHLYIFFCNYVFKLRVSLLSLNKLLCHLKKGDYIKEYIQSILDPQFSNVSRIQRIKTICHLFFLKTKQTLLSKSLSDIQDLYQLNLIFSSHLILSNTTLHLPSSSIYQPLKLQQFVARTLTLNYGYLNVDSAETLQTIDVIWCIIDIPRRGTCVIVTRSCLTSTDDQKETLYVSPPLTPNTNYSDVLSAQASSFLRIITVFHTPLHGLVIFWKCLTQSSQDDKVFVSCIELPFLLLCPTFEQSNVSSGKQEDIIYMSSPIITYPFYLEDEFLTDQNSVDLFKNTILLKWPSQHDTFVSLIRRTIIFKETNGTNIMELLIGSNQHKLGYTLTNGLQSQNNDTTTLPVIKSKQQPVHVSRDYKMITPRLEPGDQEYQCIQDHPKTSHSSASVVDYENKEIITDLSQYPVDNDNKSNIYLENQNKQTDYDTPCVKDIFSKKETKILQCLSIKIIPNSWRVHRFIPQPRYAQLSENLSHNTWDNILSFKCIAYYQKKVIIEINGTKDHEIISHVIYKSSFISRFHMLQLYATFPLLRSIFSSNYKMISDSGILPSPSVYTEICSCSEDTLKSQNECILFEIFWSYRLLFGILCPNDFIQWIPKHSIPYSPKRFNIWALSVLYDLLGILSIATMHDFWESSDATDLDQLYTILNIDLKQQLCCRASRFRFEIRHLQQSFLSIFLLQTQHHHVNNNHYHFNDLFSLTHYTQAIRIAYKLTTGLLEWTRIWEFWDFSNFHQYITSSFSFSLDHITTIINQWLSSTDHYMAILTRKITEISNGISSCSLSYSNKHHVQPKSHNYPFVKRSNHVDQCIHTHGHPIHTTVPFIDQGICLRHQSFCTEIIPPVILTQLTVSLRSVPNIRSIFDQYSQRDVPDPLVLQHIDHLMVVYFAELSFNSSTKTFYAINHLQSKLYLPIYRWLISVSLMAATIVKSADMFQHIQKLGQLLIRKRDIDILSGLIIWDMYSYLIHPIPNKEHLNNKTSTQFNQELMINMLTQLIIYGGQAASTVLCNGDLGQSFLSPLPFTQLAQFKSDFKATLKHVIRTIRQLK